ncbi:MAG: hypothetical protein B7Z60_01325 [Ferrovum sp. 37-45-19]|nr:MAG: hypothetical protein B7Z65_00210 [Ferrovum sp. 21-44-67]OYV95205.1 MAG: hypothetical protein B7Z60_01325 [Ferrovum sp. 37-45-19]OZB33775.1 MAG: hypothetical protein B7X47_03355 [Ferrovum sp. 34-44-207]HQT80707.1 DciA family protein [Ferrovaceae bacterium]HQU05917.1 DciA family protein [Ferrovaceae bacterium]
MNSRSLGNLLNQENNLQQWQNKAKLIREIELYWQNLLPEPWRDLNYVANLDQHVLLVCSTHNAVFNKLRQLETSLLGQIQAQFPHITSIKFKMVPSAPHIERISMANESLSSDTLALFEQSVMRMKKGPVAEALQKLLTHHRRKP